MSSSASIELTGPTLTITLIKGAEILFGVYYTNPDGSPMNLTGYTFSCIFRKDYASPSALGTATYVVSPGYVLFTVPTSSTINFPAPEKQTDPAVTVVGTVVATDPSGNIVGYMCAPVKVNMTPKT